jgi:spore coat polysaccharide biosynthesis protein SpsF
MYGPGNGPGMSVIISVQARLGSTRLPGKVLLHLANQRILEWVVERALSAATENVDVIVALGNEPENEALEEFCSRAGYKYVVGPEDDLLQRHLGAARTGQHDTLVRLTADCPFVPSDEIIRVINEHLTNGARYTTNNTDRMPIGTGVDAIDPELLEDLEQHGETHPVKLPRSNPEEWGTVWSDNSSWYPFSDAHIAVDTPEDYWTLSDAIEAVGHDPMDVAEWVSEQ